MLFRQKDFGRKRGMRVSVVTPVVVVVFLKANLVVQQLPPIKMQIIRKAIFLSTITMSVMMTENGDMKIHQCQNSQTNLGATFLQGQNCP